MSDRDQKMFSCAAHQFTIVANYDEASTRGSIGQRKAGCPDCTLAVNDALEYHKNCVPVEPPVLSRSWLVKIASEAMRKPYDWTGTADDVARIAVEEFIDAILESLSQEASE